MRGSVYRRGKANYWIKVELRVEYNVTGAHVAAGMVLPLVKEKRIRHQQRAKASTKAEAQRELTEILHRLGEGTYVSPSRMMLGNFLKDEWLPAIRSTVRASTYNSYAILVNKYILPALGPIKLQAITPPKLNAFYSDLLISGRRDGRGGLSPKSVRNIHATLARALGDAVRWNMIPRNVTAFADPPKLGKAGDNEMKTWDAHQLGAFLTTVTEDRLYAAYHLAASTGMRRGEVLGLRWIDVDLEGASLSVRQTLIVSDYEVQLSTPKTPRSRRQIALDKATVAALRAHRKRQQEEQMLMGPAYEGSGLVFCKIDGSPLRPDNFSQSFERHVARSGLPHIRLHDLRHTHATLALQAGIHPKIVSERLGHSTVSFTLDTYSHAIKGLQEDAAERIAGLISGE